MNFRILKKAGGFTLIELMIAIALIGTLAGIAVPIYFSSMDRARVSRTKHEIRAIEKEIMYFVMQNNRFPNDLSEIGFRGIIYPYGNPYQYLPVIVSKKTGNIENKGKARKDHNLVPVNTDFDLYSMGKDGKTVAPFTAKESRDDIVRANNGHFVGLVSEY